MKTKQLLPEHGLKCFKIEKQTASVPVSGDDPNGMTSRCFRSKNQNLNI